jgi:2-polyprenyl-3-methyl-5-hydroxy-6-metoxy-1,4-benzoquinol methylase
MLNQKQFWEDIYQRKPSSELSWTQEFPQISLDFVHSLDLPKTAKIIDIGGGESKLVDRLLDENFSDITVLDISEQALNRARERLGKRAGDVKWIAQDVLEFTPETPFDFWHDRATFHFLTNPVLIKKYISVICQTIIQSGHAVIGTFSEQGPEKCSGLPIRRYGEEDLSKSFSVGFEKLKCVSDDHITPFDTAQNFLFCLFHRL